VRHAIEMALKVNWRRLFGYALSLTGDRDEANDLLQQSALNALGNPNVPSEPKAARAWLFKIVRNAWIDQFRRSKVRRVDDDVAAAGIAVGWNFDNRVIAEITVRQGLSKIDPLHREVIELIDIHGFRYSDAAAVLDIPLGTVMSRLSRARLSLLEVIAEGNVQPMRALPRRRE
jgi:RNA polymerase sigma-70 factor, ECF subfamily